MGGGGYGLNEIDGKTNYISTKITTSGIAKPGPTRALARAMLGRAQANIIIFIILKIWTRIWAKPPNYMSRLQIFIFSM